MSGLEFVRVYIDDLLCIATSDFSDHLQKLSEVLARIQMAGLKINAAKSFFAKPELEYLGFWEPNTAFNPSKPKSKLFWT